MRRSAATEIELIDNVARYVDDPMGYVMFAFDWANDKSLQLVKLLEPWRSRYRSDWGPDKWLCEFFDQLGEDIRRNGFNGRDAVAPIRNAVSSGHGIGKTAAVGMLVNFIMSTRPNARGTVTAGTTPQLASKTWPEIAKWNRRSITGHWFEITTGRGAMRMSHKQRPQEWFCTAQTCEERNSESFAGQHAADSTSFYIFDESSAVPNVIHDVSEGGLSDGEPMKFAFGNPTRNTGWFREAFGSARHRWRTWQIDSRHVQITNKQLIADWIADEGEDSDFVRVRVRGVFPRASSQQFISSASVAEARKRIVHERMSGRVALVGVDVARFGNAQSVIRTRIGRDARSYAPIKFRGLDTMQLASRVGEHINALKAAGLKPVVFVDGGGVGGGVVDRLRQLQHDVIEVAFGSKADDETKYANKRTEMWGRLRDWLPIGAIEDAQTLEDELTSVEYGFTLTDRVALERKEMMESRGVASPDDADALALTFAHGALADEAIPADERLGVAEPRVHGSTGREYDPYDRILGRREHGRRNRTDYRSAREHRCSRIQRASGRPGREETRKHAARSEGRS